MFERISPFFDFLDYFQKILLYILYFVPVNFLLALVYGLLLRNFALLLTAVSHLFLTLVLYYFLANTKKYFFFRLLHTFLFLLALGQLRVIFWLLLLYVFRELFYWFCLWRFLPSLSNFVCWLVVNCGGCFWDSLYSLFIELLSSLNSGSQSSHFLFTTFVVIWHKFTNIFWVEKSTW